MRKSSMIAGLISAAAGAGLAAARERRQNGNSSATPRILAGASAGAAIGLAAEAVAAMTAKLSAMEHLMPKAQIAFTYPHVEKPVPYDYFAPKGSGTDFETRPSAFTEFLTPVERFYVRSHSTTPVIDLSTWSLKIEGSGVDHAVELRYDDLQALPQITLARTMECAGNGRRFFKEHFGVEAEGGQWRLGAIGTAEWTGVRLGDVLARAGIRSSARNVMPIGLDDHEVRRPMPIEKALRDDTLLVLKMNGEPLHPDHGFPARILASGWTGAAQIKWVGRILVAEEPLYSPYNTMEYVLVGPQYRSQSPALGPAITEMPVTSLLDLDWPAELAAGSQTMQGRSFAGEGRVREVAYRIDDGPWQAAELVGPDIEGCWRRWRFAWNATPGKHAIRIRATDHRGRTQPQSVPWNHHGYLYNAVVAHPVTVKA